MDRHDLTGRLDSIERRLAPADGVQVWLPVDDERDDLVRDAATGKVLMPAEVRRRGGRCIVVEYVDGRVPCG